jgi:hypothetical protein
MNISLISLVVSAKPLQNAVAASSMQTITGFQPSEISSLNEKDVRWGVLKEIDELHKYVPHAYSREASEYGVEKRVEESEIPLPPLSDEQRHEILHNLSLRMLIYSILNEYGLIYYLGVHLDAEEALPSICFYTFLNSQKRYVFIIS